MKSGKVWGTTERVLVTPFCEVHYITAKAGSRCSMHKHEHKTNCFYVLKGHLRIVVEKNDYDLVDVTDLMPHERMEVPPNEFHRFEAVTDVEALEIYYPTPISGDIVRRDHGEAK